MSVEWNRPVVLDGDRKFLSTRQGVVYLVQEEAEPQPYLSEVQSNDLQVNLRPKLATLGGDIFAVQRKRGTDSLVRIATENLRIVQTRPFGSTVEWGPERLDDSIVLTTSDQKMWVFSAEADWSVDLPFGPLAGRPLAQDGQWLCASTDGHLFAVDPESRRIDESVAFDLEEPLALGPIEFGGRLLLSGRDGTVYFATLE